MTEKVSITLNVPPRQYLALVKIANDRTTDPARPVQVHHLIEYLIVQALNGPKPAKRHRSAVDHDELTRLHALGLNDREIAQRMGFSQKTILEHRHALELGKNDRRGRTRGVA